MSFATDLEILIRARYPVIYLNTSEEARVLPVIQSVASRRNKKMFEWSFSTGLIPGGTNLQSQKARNAATKDPIAALDQVIEQVEPAIFVFKDLHPFLAKCSKSANAAPIRKLRDVALHLKNSFKTIILISPVLEIPVELEKEVTVLDYPLPTKEDLSELLDRIIADLKALKQLALELDDLSRDRLIQAALGLTWSEAENVFAKIIVKDGRLSGDDVNDVFAEKQQIIRKSGLLEYYAAADTFNDVGG
ncbi:MAG: ATPase, partial [Verrucomicrobia bacterium]|nr:ATPase [Verrucomicrobiota bacterium]